MEDCRGTGHGYSGGTGRTVIGIVGQLVYREDYGALQFKSWVGTT